MPLRYAGRKQSKYPRINLIYESLDAKNMFFAGMKILLQTPFFCFRVQINFFFTRFTIFEYNVLASKTKNIYFV